MKALRAFTVVLLLCLALSVKVAARVESEPAQDVVLKLQLEGISKQYGIAAEELKPLTDAGMKPEEIRKYLESLYPTKGFRITTEACAELRQKTGLSMEEALKCLQLSVRFGKDPELLAQLAENAKGWDELESSLLKYAKAQDAAAQASTNMKDKQRVAEAASLIATEFMCSSSDVYRLMDKGASVEQASAIAFLFDINKKDKPMQAVMRVEELPEDWMKELPEELDRFTKEWPVRDFPKEYLPLDPNKAKQASATSLSSGVKASSLPDPVDITDFSTFYNVERVSPFSEYFKNNEETVNPSSGSLVIKQTDFTLPGRYGNDFSLTRYFDSSMSRLDDYQFAVINYYEISAGSRRIDLSTDVIENPDGSYICYVLYYIFEYGNQDSGDGLAYGTMYEYIEENHFYAPPDNENAYYSSTSLIYTFDAVAEPRGQDKDDAVIGILDIVPMDDPMASIKIATGWYIDGLPIYNDHPSGPYLHLGSRGTYKLETNGLLANYDSRDMQVSQTEGNEYVYDGIIASHKLSIATGDVWYFDSDGNPIAKKDKFDQYIRVLYTNGKVSRIIDTVGRSIRFAQNNSSTTVSVYQDNNEFSTLLEQWVYTKQQNSDGSSKLVSVLPPLGPPTSFTYTEIESAVVMGLYGLSDHVTHLLLSTMTHPTQATSNYSYTTRRRAAGTDNPSSMQTSANYYMDRVLASRNDTVPTLEYSNGILVQANHTENQTSYTYGIWNNQEGSYTTTATKSRTSGESGIAPAVEKWSYDLRNRLSYHIRIGQEAGENRQRTETITENWLYSSSFEVRPFSVIEEITYSGTQETNRKRSFSFFTEYGELAKVINPDETVTDYTYDSSYRMLAKEYKYGLEASSGTKLGVETAYTLDASKKKTIAVQNMMLRMQATGVQNINGPNQSVPNDGELVWYPMRQTGEEILLNARVTVSWSTGGWGGDNQYKICIKRSQDAIWTDYYLSPFVDGGLFAKRDTRNTDIVFPEAGFWDIKVVELYGVNSAVMTANKVTYTASAAGDAVTTGYTYSPSHPGNVTTVTSYGNSSTPGTPGPVESTTTYSYDTAWNAYPVQQETIVTRADGTSSYSRAIAAYDSLGRPTLLRQEGSQGSPSETGYQYDALGRITLITNPPHEGVLTSSKSVLYIDSQRQVEITNEVGNKIRNTYDGKGRLIASEYYDAGIWRLTNHVRFDSVGNEVTITDALGAAANKQYDAFGRLIKLIRPDQTYSENWYADVNLPISSNPALDLTIPQGFNPLATKGWKKTVDAGGVASFEGYDLSGRVIWSAGNPKSSPPTGIPAWDTVMQEYDVLGRIMKTAVKRTSTAWDVTAYSYSNVQGIQQNTFGKPVMMDLPGDTEKVHSYAYDGRGNLVSETIVDGVTYSIQNSFDELNRLKLATYTSGASQMTARFFYDCRNNLTAAELYDGGVLQNALQMNYNLRGWEISETLYNGAENWTLGYAYNAAGARTRVTYPDNTYVEYEYDNRGLLSKIPGLFENLSGFGTPGFSYDANGRLTGSKSINGVISQRSYDTTGRLGSISAYISVPGDIFSQTYQYTSKDLISSITEYDGSSRTLQFAYDAIGRLTSADIYGYQDRAKVLYSYDGAGNRLTEVWKDAQNLTVESFNYAYNPGNYLASKGQESFSTGSYGQMTSRTEAGVATTYAYNPMRMMKEASEAGVTLAKYEYDALGRRIISWLDDEWRTVSLWSGNDSIYEIRQEWTTPPPNPPTETITRYVAVNGQYLAKLVGSYNSTQKYFHHTDIVGTVRAVPTSAELL